MVATQFRKRSSSIPTAESSNNGAATHRAAAPTDSKTRSMRPYRNRANKLLHVFPMPRLVEVGPKPEPFCIPHQPLVSLTVNLDRAIGIFRVNRIAPDVQIQSASGEV